jgi:SAM-dependent methyltransferase
MSATPLRAPELERIYAQRFGGAEVYRDRVWKVLTAEFFSRWVARESKVLDLGSGYCEFINNISAAVRYAMDLNPAAQQRAAKGVNVLLQDCSTPWPIEPATLDVVFTSNFFEHLPDKTALELTVSHAFASLRPGGCLIALGPNMRAIGGAYWDFYDHFIPLTDRSLTELFRKIGFEIEYLCPRFLPYTMSHGRQHPIWTLRLYLKLPLFWRLLGRQFLIVGRKPANRPG